MVSDIPWNGNTNDNANDKWEMLTQMIFRVFLLLLFCCKFGFVYRSFAF